MLVSALYCLQLYVEAGPSGSTKSMLSLYCTFSFFYFCFIGIQFLACLWCA